MRTAVDPIVAISLAAAMLVPLVMSASACAPTGAAPVVTPAPPTLLAIDVPADVEVVVDGVARGTTPVPALEVEAGPHRVELRTACTSAVVAAVEAVAEQTTTIDLAAVSDLKFAALQVTARSLDGAMLQPTLFVGDRRLRAAAPGEELAVPACTLRMRVTAEALGAFIEDIAFEPGQRYVRDVVLAPGPDVVRIPGGDFVLGPPDGTDEEGEQWGYKSLPRIPVKVATFDLDRSEVTAEQFEACRRASKQPVCEGHEDCVAIGGCPLRTSVGEARFPPRKFAHLCNLDTHGDRIEMVTRRRRHPANCLMRVEIEDYCRWVGKRLPTDVEWEYAARSGRSEYAWPWGNAREDCTRSWGGDDDCRERLDTTTEVCSLPAGNSEQGVCDLTGNVAEHVVQAQVSGRENLPGYGLTKGSDSIHGGGHAYPPFDELVFADVPSPHDGFRCARDVPPADAHQRGGK